MNDVPDRVDAWIRNKWMMMTLISGIITYLADNVDVNDGKCQMDDYMSIKHHFLSTSFEGKGDTANGLE